MKVVILHRNSFDLIGGVEGTIYNIALTLKKMDITPVVVAKKTNNVNSAADNELCKVRRYDGYKVFRLFPFLSPYYEFKNAFKSLKDIIDEESPDLIIVRDNVLSYAVSKFYDTEKIVYVPLGVIQYYNKGIRKSKGLTGHIIEVIRWISLKIESHYQNLSFKNYKKVVVFSNNMKNQIINAVGDRENVTVSPPGVMDNEYYKRKYDYSVHDEYGIPHNKKIFLFVGRIVQEKNIRMLIKAFEEMNNKDVVLFIVGGGDDLEYVKQMAVKLGVADKIVFTGFRRDTYRFYKAADFFVLPSYYESFGNVVPEAFIAGTPVIGFKTEKGKTLTAVDELIENENLGIICDDFSTKSLTKALNRAYEISMGENYQNISEYCRAQALKKYNWNVFVNNILEMTEEKK